MSDVALILAKKGSKGLTTSSIGTLLNPQATYRQTPTGGVNIDKATFVSMSIPI